MRSGCGGVVNHWARRPLPRLDSEQFRSAPRTSRSLCGRLSVPALGLPVVTPDGETPCPT
jgi:hypothetical protein